jgi:tryptophan synthase alpha chain
MSDEAERLVGRVRAATRLPVAVGFGLSSREQVAEVWRYADAAVVGSAIVAEIEKGTGRSDLVARVGEFARGLLPGGRYRRATAFSYPQLSEGCGTGGRPGV